MKKNIVFGVCFLLTSLHSLSIDDAITQTLAVHPELQALRTSYKILKEERRVSQAGYLPKLNLTYQTGVQNDKNTPPLNFEKKEYQTEGAALTVTQNIFKGFDTLYEMRAQDARVEGAKYNIKNKENRIALDMIERYTNIVRNRDLLILSKESIRTHEDIAEQIKQKSNSGFGKVSELEQVQARLELARSNEVIAQNNLAEVEAEFSYFFGEFVSPEKLLKPSNPDIVVKNLDEAYRVTLEIHPALFVQNYNIEVARADKNRGYSKYMPEVDLEASKLFNDNQGGNDARTDTSSLFLKARLNIYNGGADFANIKAKLEKVTQYSNEKDTTQREILQRLSLAWTTHTKVTQQLEFLKKHLMFISRTLDAYYEEFTLGKRDLLDILTAENEYTSAKKSYVNAEYDLLFAKYRILEAIGTLLEDFGFEFSEERAGYVQVRHLNEVEGGVKAAKDFGDFLLKDGMIEKDTNLTIEMNTTNKRGSVTDLVQQKGSDGNISSEADELKALLGDTPKNEPAKLQGEVCYKVVAKKLNAREEANTKAAILHRFKKGERVCALKEIDEWVFSDKGWVSKEFLEIEKKGSIEDAVVVPSF